VIKIKIGKNTVEYTLLEAIIGGLAILGVLLTIIGIVVKNIGTDEPGMEAVPTKTENTLQPEPDSDW
jgi:hypothetical protein